MFDFITIYGFLCCTLQNLDLLYNIIWNNTSYLYKYLSGTHNSSISMWMWHVIEASCGATAPAVCVNYQNRPSYNTLPPVLWGIYCNKSNPTLNTNKTTDFRVFLIFHDKLFNQQSVVFFCPHQQNWQNFFNGNKF